MEDLPLTAGELGIFAKVSIVRSESEGLALYGVECAAESIRLSSLLPLLCGLSDPLEVSVIGAFIIEVDPEPTCPNCADWRLPSVWIFFVTTFLLFSPVGSPDDWFSDDRTVFGAKVELGRGFGDGCGVVGEEPGPTFPPIIDGLFRSVLELAN